MMFTNEFNGHGGDVQDALPSSARKIKNQPVAYGEKSGHVHVITGSEVELFEDDEGNRFAVVGNNGAFHQHINDFMLTEETYKVNKNISNADHTKPCLIKPGVYFIGIHQRYNPYEKVFQKSYRLMKYCRFYTQEELEKKLGIKPGYIEESGGIFYSESQNMPIRMMNQLCGKKFQLSSLEIDEDGCNFETWTGMEWAIYPWMYCAITEEEYLGNDQVAGNHYQHLAIQPLEFIEKNNLPFFEGNVVKYICRHSHKNGKEDLLKAIDYINKIIEYRYGK